MSIKGPQFIAGSVGDQLTYRTSCVCLGEEVWKWLVKGATWAVQGSPPPPACSLSWAVRTQTPGRRGRSASSSALSLGHTVLRNRTYGNHTQSTLGFPSPLRAFPAGPVRSCYAPPGARYSFAEPTTGLLSQTPAETSCRHVSRHVFGSTLQLSAAGGPAAEVLEAR